MQQSGGESVRLVTSSPTPTPINSPGKVVLIQNGQGQLVAVPASQIQNISSKIPPRASSAPPTQAAAIRLLPSRPASVDTKTGGGQVITRTLVSPASLPSSLRATPSPNRTVIQITPAKSYTSPVPSPIVHQQSPQPSPSKNGLANGSDVAVEAHVVETRGQNSVVPDSQPGVVITNGAEAEVDKEEIVFSNEEHTSSSVAAVNQSKFEFNQQQKRPDVSVSKITVAAADLVSKPPLSTAVNTTVTLITGPSANNAKVIKAKQIVQKVSKMQPSGKVLVKSYGVPVPLLPKPPAGENGSNPCACDGPGNDHM